MAIDTSPEALAKLRKHAKYYGGKPEEVLALIDALEKARELHQKWMSERPVAPHPKDQLANLSRALHEDAEAECEELRKTLKEARDYIQSTMKLVHRQRAQEALKAIDAALTQSPAKGELATVCLNAIASNEPCKPDDTLKRCTICGFIVDVKYKAEFPAKGEGE